MISNYVILTLCILVLLSYIFDISFKYSKIPGVVLLIGMGILLQIVVNYTKFDIPNLRSILPVLGTLGLILIVMDAALEIKLESHKAKGLGMGVLSSLFLLITFVTILTFIVVKVWDQPVRITLLNVIPLGIISSAVAISSAVLLSQDQREFITFESAVSDIFGILVFDFILLNEGSIVNGLLIFGFKGLITIVIAAVMTTILAYMLHRIQYHVSYIIILASVVLIYILAKLVHLPGLFLVVVFGLALSNYRFVENTIVNKFVNFDKFRDDIISFKKILAELTFLVRSFFFIMFGFYTSLAGFVNFKNLIFAAAVTVGIFILRWIFLQFLLGKDAGKLIWFAPRGLITILLFLSIPEALRMDLVNEEVVTLVILMSIFVMMLGNMIPDRNKNRPEKIKSVA